MKIGKVIKIHEPKRDTQVRSVPVRPSERADKVRRIIQDVPPVTQPEPEREPEKVKVR